MGRVRIGHTGDRRHPAGGRGAPGAGEGFLVFGAGFAQMGAHVDKAGGEAMPPQSTTSTPSGNAIGEQAGAEVGDAPALR